MLEDIFNKWIKVMDFSEQYKRFKTTIIPYSEAHANKCRREVAKMFAPKQFLSIERDIIGKGLDIRADTKEIVKNK